jgi:NAD-dependent dihydropyrimidine dehydrogenase PreA subunit
VVKARISIDRARCSLCYRCVELCPSKVFIVVNKSVVAVDDRCVACFGCVKVCPSNAIDVKIVSYSVVEYVRYN